jgi:hypothetical protein
VKRGTPEHPKTKALARRLGVPWPMAVGTLELLWHFTARYAPAGDIGRFPDEAIAAAVGWPENRDRAELVRALCDCGWLDPHPEHRLMIHDWPDHCEDAVHVFLARRGLTFACGKPPKTSKLSKSERRAHNVPTECAPRTHPGCTSHSHSRSHSRSRCRRHCQSQSHSQSRSRRQSQGRCRSRCPRRCQSRRRCRCDRRSKPRRLRDPMARPARLCVCRISKTARLPAGCKPSSRQSAGLWDANHGQALHSNWPGRPPAWAFIPATFWAGSNTGLEPRPRAATGCSSRPLPISRIGCAAITPTTQAGACANRSFAQNAARHLRVPGCDRALPMRHREGRSG